MKKSGIAPETMERLRNAMAKYPAQAVEAFVHELHVRVVQQILEGGPASKAITFENDPTREGELVVIGLGGRKCRHGCLFGRPRLRCPCSTNKGVRDEVLLLGQALCEMVLTHRVSGMSEPRRGFLTAAERGVEV